MGSLLPIFNTASEVGYGATIASLPAFAMIRDAVLNVAPGNPVISLAVAVNVLAGITGSASGGMSIALQTLGETYASWRSEYGISLELMHRVAALASGGFDSLPHNGAVITLLAICGLTHRQSYADIGMVAVVIPVAALDRRDRPRLHVRRASENRRLEPPIRSRRRLVAALARRLRRRLPPNCGWSPASCRPTAFHVPPPTVAEGGEPMGLVYEVVREIARRVGHSRTVEFLPWTARPGDGDDRARCRHPGADPLARARGQVQLDLVNVVTDELVLVGGTGVDVSVISPRSRTGRSACCGGAGPKRCCTSGASAGSSRQPRSGSMRSG